MQRWLAALSLAGARDSGTLHEFCTSLLPKEWLRRSDASSVTSFSPHFYFRNHFIPQLNQQSVSFSALELADFERLQLKPQSICDAVCISKTLAEPRDDGEVLMKNRPRIQLIRAKGILLTCGNTFFLENLCERLNPVSTGSTTEFFREVFDDSPAFAHSLRPINMEWLMLYLKTRLMRPINHGQVYIDKPVSARQPGGFRYLLWLYKCAAIPLVRLSPFHRCPSG